MFIEEFDLLNFFATTPEQLDPNVPWTYNDSVYEAVDGHVQISFAIRSFRQGCQGDLEIEWHPAL